MSAEEVPPAQELIYGCMGLGGSWSAEPYTAADVDQAAAAVDAALEAGITLFDHADIYRGGKAEAVFGERCVLAWTPGLRAGRLQTKCGIRLGENGLNAYYDLSGEAIRERVNGSLARLKTDCVDVLMLHRPDPLLDPAEVASAVGRLMAEGKVRSVGVSETCHPAQIELLQDRLEAPVVANQLEMSLGARAWLESTVLVNHADGTDYSFPHGTVEHCVRRGIGLQAYGALAQGRYTGAAGGGDAAASATAELVAAMAAEKGTTGETVVLGWLMKHPAGISPVIGSANPERIRACAGAADVAAAMTRPEWYRLWITARGSNIP